VLIPKPAERARKFFLPPMADWGLPWPFRRLMPIERKALQAIVETADLIVVDGAPPHLLIPAYPHLLEILAAFEAEIEDDENDLEDEENGDREDDTVNDAAHERRDDGQTWPYDDEEGDGTAPLGAAKSREAFIARRRGTRLDWYTMARETKRIRGAIEALKRLVPKPRHWNDVL
jgi:hypothetical protein